MKTQVDEQAVLDLLDKIPWAACRVREVLETIHSVLPMLEADNEIEAMRAAVLAEARRDPTLSQTSLDIAGRLLLNCIRELDNYQNKRAVVEAALAKINNVEDNSSELERMLPEVKAVFGNLDQRTKEIFGVFKELMSVSSHIDADYLNEVLEVVTAKPKILRNEKKLAVIMKAYDLARPINQAV